MTGHNYIGGLTGQSDGDTDNSNATGIVTGNDYVGGLAGESDGDTNNSNATGVFVRGSNNIGGLVGSQGTGANINDSYATGSVVGTSNNIGGLVGIQDSNSNIRNSYATGNVTGNDYVGGLVGIQNSNSSIIISSYATGPVFGDDYVGGLVGESSNISNILYSYYAARGQSNEWGEERTFKQLRCPTMPSATCSLSDSDQMTYKNWDTNVWGFGSATELPQLLGNRNSELNLKPYVKGSADFVVMTEFTGIKQLPLEADYLGPPRRSAFLTWSLSGVPDSLRDFVYFDLGDGTTRREFRKPKDGAGMATLVVAGDRRLADKSFYVVLKSSISANDDRVRILLEETEQPFIKRTDDIRQVGVETTRLSFSVAYAGPAEQGVTLTWSLSDDVPTSLRHLIYFDLGNSRTGITFIDTGTFTAGASKVTLVVVGNKELAGRSFYVVLKNDISANDDRVRVQIEGEPPKILRDDGGRPATVGRTNTFSFSVGYTGSPVPVTLTWSLSDVPSTLRDLVYFNLGGGRTGRMFTDSGKLTGTASSVTLVVVGSELADKGFYVVLKNNLSDSDDRVQVRIASPPNIVRNDDIRPAPVGSTTTLDFSVDYTGFLDPVTLTWSLSDVPPTLRHLVYFRLVDGTTGTMFTDSGKLAGSASSVTLVVVGNEELAGRSFYVVIKNNVSAKTDRVQVRTEVGPPNILGDNDRPVPIGSTIIFSFSVDYTGSSDPVTLTWSLSGVPNSLRHLVYFDLGDGRTGRMFTDSAKLTSSANPITLMVVGNEELAGRSFYVVLKNNVSANDDRVQIQIQGPTAIRLRAKVYLGGAVR